ncbi:helix-turn-helix transcriptional regulator [Psychrobacter sp. AOP7-C1-14]|uniref:helix-turn-helix transcriptional regulator n=1 Tax=Psychrobacter sp. AOP7-C1-14 TaxID=3457640 RepID=UPI00402B8F85
MLESDTPTKTHKNKDLAKLLPLQGMSRAKNILPLLPFGRTTLHEWSRDGRFPASIRLSPTIVAWKNSEVLEWLERQSLYPSDSQEVTND